MKIKSVSLENITSYRDRTQFDFDDELNILIGPNGGGKSNLQKVLALVLSKYFVHQYEFKRNDNEVAIEPLEPWSKRAVQRSLAPYLGNEDSAQIIELELKPDAADVENIRTIAKHLETFNDELSFWERRYDSYAPMEQVTAIEAADSFSYRITNFDFDEVDTSSAAWGYREYLRTLFIFMRVADRVPDVRLTSPLFFFFSERTSSRNVQVQSNQLSAQQYHTGFRSAYQAAMGDNTDLLQWGAQHFARIHWKAVNEAAGEREALASEIFRGNVDVQLLTRYLNELGYRWGFLYDPDSVSYPLALQREGQEFPMTADKFSSGEREIVHFLLAMFALNVTDGLVLVDEPELHLHPRWQRIFLGLFREIAPSRNNQFLIATHSPVFVSPDTIDSVTRIYQHARGGSARVALKEVKLPKKKSLVRMINSQNNERVFFADKVVLVEGMKDRVVIGALLESCAAHFQNYEAIEIVEAGGTGNFAEYRALLAGLETPSFIVADLDYLTTVGQGGVQDLFQTRPDKEWAALTDKKSLDAAESVRLLKAAVASGDTDLLGQFLDYVEGRFHRLRSKLTREERTLLRSEIKRLREEEQTYLWSGGEIEDYLPPDVSSMKSVVGMIQDPSWVNRVEGRARRAEMIECAASIMGVEGRRRDDLRRAAWRGEVPF